MTGTLPTRSVSRPDSGDSPNIPNVWPLMTMPTAPSVWPCSVMWSGVIVMIRTMTTWPVTRATMATGTCGRRSTDRSDTAMDASGRRDRAATSRRRGRTDRVAGASRNRIAAAPTKMIGTKNGPASSGRPRFAAKIPAGATRFGPTIAPTVAPQTTRPIAEARRASG